MPATEVSSVAARIPAAGGRGTPAKARTPANTAETPAVAADEQYSNRSTTATDGARARISAAVSIHQQQQGRLQQQGHQH